MAILAPMPSVHPPPAYLAFAAASQMATDNEKLRLGNMLPEGTTNTSDQDVALFSEGALALINAFLDQLLYSFLSHSRSTTMSSLRPAVGQVLKGKLARQAIYCADDELDELLSGGDDNELSMVQQEQDSRTQWNLEMIWRRTRLRIMVYMRLGEMEDEDEERYIEQDESLGQGGVERRSSQSAGLVSWAAAIFLTSVLEYIAEQCLLVAGSAAYARFGLERSTRAQYDSELNERDIRERVLIEEHDVERLALNSSLGRLWRTWRKNLRSQRSLNFHSPHSPSSSQRLSASTIHPDHSVRQEGVWQPLTHDEENDVGQPSALDTDGSTLQIDGTRVHRDTRTKDEDAPELTTSTARPLKPFRSLVSLPAINHGLPTPISSPPATPQLVRQTMQLMRHRSYSLPNSGPAPFPLKSQKSPYKAVASAPGHQEAYSESSPHQSGPSQPSDAVAMPNGVIEPGKETAPRLFAVDSVSGDFSASTMSNGVDETVNNSARSPIPDPENGTFDRRGYTAVGSRKLPRITVMDECFPASTTTQSEPGTEETFKPRHTLKVMNPSAEEHDPRIMPGPAPRRELPDHHSQWLHDDSEANSATGTSRHSPRHGRHGTSALPSTYANDRVPLQHIPVVQSQNPEKTASIKSRGSGHESSLANRPNSSHNGLRGRPSIGTSVTRSEISELDFVGMTNGAGRMKYNRTVESLGEIDRPDVSGLKNEAVATGIPMSGMRISPKAPMASHNMETTPLPAQFSDTRAKAASIGSTASSATGSDNQAKTKILSTRPPRSNPRPSKGGYVAREARVQTEPVRDFADFIRSTAPSREPPPVQPFMSTPGSPKVGGTMLKSIPAKQPSRASPSSAVGTLMLRATKSPSAQSKMGKIAKQPRDPVNSQRGNKDLIAFLRQGPPGLRVSGSGEPLNSHSPDRLTMTSANRTSSMTSHSLDDSVHSNSGLLTQFSRQQQPMNVPAANVSAFQTNNNAPVRTQQRVKDPYALPDSDDEDDDFITALPKQTESLMDFLKNVEPSSTTTTQQIAANEEHGAPSRTSSRLRKNGPSLVASSSRRPVSPIAETDTTRGTLFTRPTATSSGYNLTPRTNGPVMPVSRVTATNNVSLPSTLNSTNAAVPIGNVSRERFSDGDGIDPAAPAPVVSRGRSAKGRPVGSIEVKKSFWKKIKIGE